MAALHRSITIGTRVICIGGSDFRALTVISGTSGYVRAAYPGRGGERSAPAGSFLAVPPDWPDPPPSYLSRMRILESAYSGPIPAGLRVLAEAEDNCFPAAALKLEAAEAWLAWVQAQLHPLAPDRFEPHLQAALAACAAARQSWLQAALSESSFPIEQGALAVDAPGIA